MNDWPRTAKDKPAFLRTVGAVSIPDDSHLFALCCLFVVSPRRTHGGEIVLTPLNVAQKLLLHAIFPPFGFEFLLCLENHALYYIKSEQ